MKIWKVMLTALPLAALLTATAWAQPPAKRHGPCADDVEKFCKDAKPGTEIRQCLEAHKAELSAACKERFEKMAARRQERQQQAEARRAARHKACKDDIDKFCKDERGGGRVMQCLRKHEAELSEACKTELASRPRRGQTPK